MKYLLLCIVSFAVLQACSGKMENNNENKVEIEILKIDSWFNLMPGGPSSFHIAGEVTIENKGKNTIENIDLSNIKVYENDTLIYSIKPFFNLVKGESQHYINSEQKNIYLFGTKPGLKINSRIEDENYIRAELLFDVNDSIVIKVIDSLFVEKAY